MIMRTASDSPKSTTPKNREIAKVTTSTTPVDCRVACRVGQETRLNSDVTSWTNALNLLNMPTFG